jgi:iron complex transport system substrate-binding protein
VRFHAVKLDTLADVFEAIRTISEALGVPDRGRELAGEVRRGLDATRERVSGRPRQRVLAVVGRTPGDLGGLATVGPRSVLGDLLAVAGGSNLFADAAGPYPQISKESILVRKPDVILELSPGPLPDGTLRMLREDWSRLPGIPAVEAGRIHYLTNSYLLIPGPRVADAAARLAEAMHPRGGVAP